MDQAANYRGSASQFRALVEMTSEAILINQRNRVVYLNPAAVKLFGAASKEEIIGRPALDLFHPDYHEIIRGRIASLRVGHSVPDLEEKIIRLDGTVVDVEVSGTAFMYGKEMAVNVVIRDITERKKAEAERQAAEEDLRKALEKAEHSDQLKTAFLNNLSHEIRTPLNAIVGFSSLIGDENQTRDQIKNFAGIISKSSDQLLGIIEDIITISMIQTGQINVQESETNLGDLIDKVVARHGDKAARKGIEFIWDPAMVPRNTIVMADHGKLLQVLSHLVDNAIKFTDHGRVVILCSFVPENVLISVSDTGIGIDTSLGDLVFNQFYQRENEISRKKDGLGIGLPIAKAFIESMNGKLWYEPGNGSGTSFYMMFPFKPVNGNIMAPENNLPEAASKKKVLVAEDEQSNFLLIQEILSGRDLDILHAWNGRQAVDMVHEHPDIDLVLMDIKMPLMSGYEAAGYIKGIRAGLPIIALTANAMHGDREKALEAGCVEYLTKPFPVKTLVKFVDRYLGIC
jgi:two-component system, sensor histidine kinase and response regulator